MESLSSIGMSQKSTKNPHTSDINFTPELIDNYQFDSIAIFTVTRQCIFSSCKSR